jgi:hypothetical protein
MPRSSAPSRRRDELGARTEPANQLEDLGRVILAIGHDDLLARGPVETGEAEIPVLGETLGLIAPQPDLDRTAARPLRHRLAQPGAAELAPNVEGSRRHRAHRRGFDRDDAIGAPQPLAGVLPRAGEAADQIPAVAIPKQPRGLGLDLDRRAAGPIGRAIGEANPRRIEHGGEEDLDGARLALDGARRSRQLGVERVGRGALEADEAPRLGEQRSQMARQGGDQLALGAVERRGEGRHFEPAHESEAEQHGDRLAAIERDRRQEESLEQPIAALHAALGIDRHAGRAQHLDVAIDRAYGDLEAARQRASGDRTAIAQQQQDGEAALDPGHSRSLTSWTAKSH